ncbi:MAG: hybrid sensor histidine kinase/response regulator [Chloroflexi bacterium]|nr:hybrid sensor histidine kinase/response regulator [Chloroflexota bacterium]
MTQTTTEKAKILIIDDEEVVLDSCLQILKGGAFEIQTASNGSDGLQKVEAFQPDLVFVDLKMPGISGFEVLEKVHTLDSTIVVVVITGFATVSSAVDAMKKGAYDFLPKPFTPDEFRLITRRSVERRRLMLEAIALRREKELLREQFASIVSHELKTPLSAVQQNLFALEFELEKAMTEDQKGKFERIKTRIGDMLKLINSWLRVITVDSNKLKEGFKPLSIAGPINAAIENLATLAARKGIQVEFSAGDPPPVNGDSLSLSEVFINIIGNSLKYSPDFTRVSIQIQVEEKQIKVSIRDEGIGIPPEDLPHIFDGFYRGKSGQEAAAGHGIGLAVARQIVEAHEGTVSAESAPGKGTTFIVSLPILSV